MNIITNYIQINKICIYVYILIYHFFKYIFNIQFLLKYHIYILLYTWIFEIQANQGSFRLSSIVVSIRGRFRFESGLNDTGMNTLMNDLGKVFEKVSFNYRHCLHRVFLPDEV